MRCPAALALFLWTLLVAAEGADHRLGHAVRSGRRKQAPPAAGWMASLKSMVGWSAAVTPPNPQAPSLSPAVVPAAVGVAVQAPVVVPPPAPRPPVAVRMMAARRAQRHAARARAHVALRKHVKSHVPLAPVEAPAAAAGPPPPPLAAGAPGSAVAPAQPPAERLSEVDQEMAEHLAANADKEVQEAAEEAEKESQEALEEASAKRLRDLQASQSKSVENAEAKIEVAGDSQVKAMEAKHDADFKASEHVLSVYAAQFFVDIKNSTEHLGAQAADKAIKEAEADMVEHIHAMNESSISLIRDQQESVQVANNSKIQAAAMTIIARQHQKEAMKIMNTTFYEIHRAKRTNNETSVWVRNATVNASNSRSAADAAKDHADESLNKASEAELGAKEIKGQVFTRAAKITTLISSVAAAMEQAAISEQQAKQVALMVQDLE